MPSKNIDNLNRTEYSNRQGFSKFDLSKKIQFTPRMGEITPFFCTRTIFDDDFKTRFQYNVMNYITMDSPLLQSMRSAVDFYAVPRKAMIPHTYDRQFIVPNKGDTVPVDAYPSIDLRAICKLFLTVIKRQYDAQHTSQEATVNSLTFYALTILYHLCGYGTLPDLFNVRSAAFGRAADPFGHPVTFGKYFDLIMSSALERLKGLNFTFADSSNTNILQYVIKSPTEFASMMWTLANTQQEIYLKATNLKVFDLEPLVGAASDSFYSLYNPMASFGHDDPLPFVAYQMVSAQYYSLDTVDYVVSYDLWLMAMEGIAQRIQMVDSPGTAIYPAFYHWNGYNLQYDLFSKYVLNRIMLCIAPNFSTDTGSFNEQAFLVYSFYMNLFTFRSPLRRVDYFAGSRVRPLAVGDVDIIATADSGDVKVSAVDVTKGILYQRFYNAVNRTRQTLHGYVKSIFGSNVAADTLAPICLCSRVQNLKSIMNVNTAESQGDRRLNISSNTGDKLYSMQFNQEYYVIGCFTTDMRYSYPYTTDRLNFHQDIYDDYQPMLQDIGDQEIYRAELQSALNAAAGAPDAPFGYQLQDAEYKFSYDTAHGGFVNNLPSWSFVDYNSFYEKNISPGFLRINPYDFDRFFKSLSGWSLESRFHLIVDFDLFFTAVRKMKYKPGIL